MAKRLLIVDDAISMRGLISMTLKKEGYEVVEAEDGVAALAKAKGGKFDLVISDLNMPNMDGISLIKALKADPGHRFTPIVMLTTENADSKKNEGRVAGAKAWIVKPFKPETLVAVVKKIIG